MKRLTIFIIPVLLALLGTSPAQAATAGKVAGIVTDAATGKPLAGVRVMLAGTQHGDTTNAEGHYMILAVDPGVYTFTAALAGYKSEKQDRVQVLSDYTSTVDFALTQASGGMTWRLVMLLVAVVLVLALVLVLVIRRK